VPADQLSPTRLPAAIELQIDVLDQITWPPVIVVVAATRISDPSTGGTSAGGSN
jgi:hypothetical protein